MSLLPKIKRCPACETLNIVLINGILYDNNFKSLQEWTLKKVFNCKKCKVKLALCLRNYDKTERLIWIDYFKCQDNHYDILLKLEQNKTKYFKTKFNKKYYITTKEIIDIQNKIRSDQVKLKIKLKIQKTMSMRYAY